MHQSHLWNRHDLRIHSTASSTTCTCSRWAPEVPLCVLGFLQRRAHHGGDDDPAPLMRF
jgi:hypothetical protein